MREAFAYAFDREAYCRDLAASFCTPALSWIPPGAPGSIATDAYAYDPGKARAALAASSYGEPEKLPEIIWYVIAEDPFEAVLGDWLAAQYQQVLGVTLTLTPIPADAFDALFWVDSATWPQMSSFSWYQDYPDPHDWLSVYWTCGAAFFAVWVGYCNPTFDALVAQADAELDPERRMALYEEAGRLLVADVPTIFAYTPTNVMLVNPALTGYSTTAPNYEWPGWWTPLTVDIAPAD